MVRVRRIFLSLLLAQLPAVVSAGAPADWPAQVETLVQRGLACQTRGQNQSAVSALEEAVTLAEKIGDRRLILRAKSSLGAVCTCSRHAAQTEQTLRECLTLAAKLPDPNTTGLVFVNLGNLYAAEGRLTNALAAYQQAAQVPATAAKANANAAAVAVDAKLAAEAERLNGAALAQLPALNPAHEQALLWLRCGQTDLQLHQWPRAGQSFQKALQIADQLNDPLTRTYALGSLGRLAELQTNLEQALAFTRQAAFIAQEIQSPEALYRWEWQTGRLLAAAGKPDEALAAYRRAAQTLQPIRAELTQGCGAARPSFREAVAPVYYELADLLLRRDDSLAEARETIEQLKSAELDDYLQDECAAIQHAQAAKAAAIAPHTVVIHIIPLADRTEVLLTFHEGLERVRLPISADQLTTKLREFRLNLERRTTNQYLTEAKELYDWLIAPLRSKLSSHQIDTLVLVPDGALRTVPLGALYDGEHYLIEQFAMAVTPGVMLMDASPMARGRLHVLAAGLSKSTHNFSELPNVPAELQAVASTFHGPVLLDEQFTSAMLRQDFEREQFQIIHLATHGQVDKDIRQSFILTHDGRLTLDDLESLLRPGQHRGKPLELLTLSACQTAAGDDRAALGLAGMAIKAGARSTLASLWFVHDESTGLLMAEFYRHLQGEDSTTKAKALQQAQLKVLHDPRFEHPCYWAPFLIIGNWL